MTNILVFTPLALENGRGGEISAMELASGLQKDFNVTFMDTNIMTGDRLLTEKIIKENLAGIKSRFKLKFITFKVLNRTFTFPIPSEIYKLYKVLKNQDVIYSSFFNIKFNSILILFRLLNRNLKVIIGYRKPVYSKKLFSLYNLKLRASILLMSLFKRNLYHHTLSNHVKHFLNNFYGSESVNHIIHGINLDKYKSLSIKQKNLKVLSFCYIGFLDIVHKGTDVLIEAIDQFLHDNKNLNVVFEISGMGPLDFRVKELENKFPKYVKFNGYIKNDLIPQYYNKSDVYLFTSRQEPFPRALMEALAAKLVIISSKTIGSVELLKGQKFAFFIDNLNAKSLKDKIFEVYNVWKENSAEFRKLQEKAKEFVFNNYSFERELEMFRTLIKKITITE